MSNINELKARGCKVLHCVDATQMANHPQLCHIKFDRIIFNFPLAGFFPKEISRQLQIQSVNYHYLCFLTIFFFSYKVKPKASIMLTAHI